MKKPIKIFIALFLLTLPGLIDAQTATNLSQFLDEINNVSAMVSRQCDTSAVYLLQVKPLKEYSVFLPRFSAELEKDKIKITKERSPNRIILSIENIGVYYSKPFRKWLLSNFEVQREISMEGSYTIFTKGKPLKANTFAFVKKDSVSYEDLKSLETPSLAFTKGKIPEAPFLTSFFEPLIALAAVIISIYLLFSVRSK